MKTRTRFAVTLVVAAPFVGFGASGASAHTGSVSVSCTAITAELHSFPTRGADIVLSANVGGTPFTSTQHLPGSVGVVSADISELTDGNHSVTITDISASWDLPGAHPLHADPVTLNCGPPPTFDAKTHASALCQVDGRYRVEVVIENKGDMPFSVSGDSFPMHLADVPTLQPEDRVVSYIYVPGTYESTSYTLTLSASDETTHTVTGAYPRNVPTGDCKPPVTTTTGQVTTTTSGSTTTQGSSTTAGRETTTTKVDTRPTLASTGPKEPGGFDSGQLALIAIAVFGTGGLLAGLNRRRIFGGS